MSEDSSRFVGVVRTVLACAAGSENTAQCPSTSFEKHACKEASTSLVTNSRHATNFEGGMIGLALALVRRLRPV